MARRFFDLNTRRVLGHIPAFPPVIQKASLARIVTKNLARAASSGHTQNVFNGNPDSMVMKEIQSHFLNSRTLIHTGIVNIYCVSDTPITL